MRTSSFRHAPDGMRLGGLERERLAGVVLAHERHDDGLVHNHGWALTTNTNGGRAEGGHFDAAAMLGRVDQGMRRAMAEDDRYDDGLVHNHHWAVTAG